MYKYLSFYIVYIYIYVYLCVCMIQGECGTIAVKHCHCMFRSTMCVLIVCSMSHHCTLQQKLCQSLRCSCIAVCWIRSFMEERIHWIANSDFTQSRNV